MLLKTGQLRVALWAKLDKETPISPCSQTECVHHSGITIFQKQLVWNLTQMDIENKTHGSGKCSIWCVRIAAKLKQK